MRLSGIAFAAMIAGGVSMVLGTSELLASSACSGGAKAVGGGPAVLQCGGECQPGETCQPFYQPTIHHAADATHPYPWDETRSACACVDALGNARTPAGGYLCHTTLVVIEEFGEFGTTTTQSVSCVKIDCPETYCDDRYTTVWGEPPAIPTWWGHCECSSYQE